MQNINLRNLRNLREKNYSRVRLFVLLPALNLQLILAQCAECLDEGGSKTGIGEQRNVVVDGTTTDSVTIGELTLGVILRDVDDEVELVVGNHLHNVRDILMILIRPSYG